MTQRPFDPTAVGRPPSRQPDFDEFEATELYCTRCGKAVPVRKSLLLVLPEGDKYEYRCALCGNTVGDKIDRSAEPFSILKTRP
jgi:endogenous inhibitor of DNA gyrase (YacG/DUF329 family)